MNCRCFLHLYVNGTGQHMRLLHRSAAELMAAGDDVDASLQRMPRQMKLA
jgi:hypothetical protein